MMSSFIMQLHLLFKGGGRRRGTKENGGSGLNRANTMVYNNMQGQAYAGLSYSTNTGNRPQFYLNQIPYVNPPSQTEYVEWFSRYIDSASLHVF